jgi:hypothetical protein
MSTSFRHWVHNLWIDNCEEHYIYQQPRYTEQEYFQKYKWWLRREYRHQQQKQRKMEEYRKKFG